MRRSDQLVGSGDAWGVWDPQNKSVWFWLQLRADLGKGEERRHVRGEVVWGTVLEWREESKEQIEGKTRSRRVLKRTADQLPDLV